MDIDDSQIEPTSKSTNTREGVYSENTMVYITHGKGFVNEYEVEVGKLEEIFSASERV